MSNWASPEDLGTLFGVAPPPQRRNQPERRFTDQVKRYARRGGWLTFHPYRSEKSDPGFLDLTLIRVPRLVVAELKIPPNGTSPWQEVWLAYWRALALLSGPHLSIEVFIWTPDDWPQIEEILR